MLSRIARFAVIAVTGSACLAAPLSAREITHAMGVTEVPDNPTRIVVLTNEGTEALLAIGITPVGAARSWLGDPWYDHISDQMEGVTVLGEESAINLEVLVSLSPDLILGNKLRHEAVYEQLSAIAPTVISERLRGDWQINMALYADAVGKADEGHAAMDAFDARVAALGAALGDHLQEEISIVRFTAAQIRMYQKDNFAGIILDQLGFHRPATQQKPEFVEQITKERIPELNGDRLIYFTYDTGNGDAAALTEEWVNEPLWQNLPVVQAGKVHVVSDAIWNTAGGIIAANLLLDDIEGIYSIAPTR
ncbi:MAG: iron-siderophore ABC transporter substrate-binding protein [Paracoccus sp. (in: a-proteobacteria)]|nr:iron-siderophore ABC transporter substrate-binding protein [Paracoccus sp. (in: a-proteobacteria)]